MTLRDADGNECDLPTLCCREPGWAANRIDTLTKERDAWKGLYAEYHRAYGDAANKLDVARGILERNGCDCDCGCDTDGHVDGHEPCLACELASAIQ